MHKYLKFLVIFFLSASPLFAIDGFMVSGSVGGAYYPRKELYKEDHNSDIYSYSTDSTLNFPTYKLTAGYEFYNMGFTLNLLRNSFSYDIDDSTSSNTIKEKDTTTAFYAQIYYKFSLHSDFSPFIGGGYGIYGFRNTLQGIDGRDIKISRNKYMYSVLAGLMYNFADQLALGLTYETYYIPKFSYEGNKAADGYVTYYGRDKYLAHNLYFTLKYYFY